MPIRALTCAAMLAVLAPADGRAQCLLGCDVELLGAEAAERLRHDLGGSLPAGTEVVGLVEGGFMDRFIQARLSTDAAGRRALLAALGVRESDLVPTAAPYLGPPAPPWFDWADRTGLKAADGSTGSLPHVSVALAPDPAARGEWVVYLWGFET